MPPPLFHSRPMTSLAIHTRCVYTEWVNAAVILRQSRQEAGLTQRQLAEATGSSQPAIAAYESGRRVPHPKTLETLLERCGFDLSYCARPRIRRGAQSLAELVPTIQDDLGRDREADARRLLFGFADDFRGSSMVGQRSLIAERPAPTGDPRYDAALAGMAEYFAREAQILAPSWVDDPDRFVEPWWFVTDRQAFHAYVMANTPAVFAKHGIFMAREVFNRV